MKQIKEDFLQNRELLIGHLQEKIQSLKKQRENYMRTSTNENKSNQNKGFVRSSNNSKKQKDKIEELVINMPEVKSKADLIRQKQQTKLKLQALEDIYKKKKFLQNAGIYESDSAKISSIYATKKDKLSKQFTKNKQKAEEKLIKEKIVQQQMQKVESFLKQSKKVAKKNSQKPSNHYSKLLSQGKQLLDKYEKCLLKRGLLQKQKILEISFDLLAEWDKKVQREKLSTFLLSNVEFCEVFLITKEQILRDLSVYQTVQPNRLTYNEFCQFVKSIEITNKTLKPNLKHTGKQKIIKQKQIIVNKIDTNIEMKKQLEIYAKKLFKTLDNRNQNIVQRQKIETAIKKGLFYDLKKYKYLNKDHIGNFSTFILNERNKIKNSSYYQQLDYKYIGIEELLKYCKTYAKVRENSQASRQNQKSQQRSESQQQISSQQIQDDTQSQPQIEVQQSEINDYQKYGFGKQETSEGFSKLSQLDKYYKQVGEKYGNQIRWNRYEPYQQDFTKFNKAIKQLNRQRLSKQKQQQK